jgi:hypothetical protein
MKEIEQEVKGDYATNDEHCNKNIRLLALEMEAISSEALQSPRRHTHTHTHIHIYIYTYIYIHTHTHVSYTRKVRNKRWKTIEKLAYLMQVIDYILKF